MATFIIIAVIIILVVVIVKATKQKNNATVSQKIITESLSFNPNPVPSGEKNNDIVELLNKKYTPKTGNFDFKIYATVQKDFKVGDPLEVLFKTKKAYYQELYLPVAFKHGEDIISIMGEFYLDNSPLMRLIRAHFSGYTIHASIKELQDVDTIINIKLSKDGEAVENKVKRKKSDKTTGEFIVKGFYHLPKDIQRLVVEEINHDHELHLIPDPKNQHDSKAIKVMFGEHQIGWVAKDYYQKRDLFNALMNGKEIKARITSKFGLRDYRPTGPENEYLRYATFNAKFEMDKEEK